MLGVWIANVTKDIEALSSFTFISVCVCSVGSLELHWGESQLARLASVSFTIVSFTTVQSAPALVSALLLYNCTTVSYKSMLLSEVQKYNELRTRKWPVEKFKVATTSIKAVKCSNAIFRLPAWLHPAKFGLYFPSSSSSLYTCKIFISTTIHILVLPSLHSREEVSSL